MAILRGTVQFFWSSAKVLAPLGVEGMERVPQSKTCSFFRQPPWEAAAAANSTSTLRSQWMGRWFLPEREKSKRLVRDTRSPPVLPSRGLTEDWLEGLEK